MTETLKLTIKMTKNKTLRTPIKKEKKKKIKNTHLKKKKKLRTKMTIRDMSFGYICIFTESVKSERKIAKAKKNKGKVSNELEEIRLALVWMKNYRNERKR